VLFQGEEFLVAGHEELGLAGFSQREQITVLGVRRDGAGGQIPAKKRLRRLFLLPSRLFRAVRSRQSERTARRTEC
jgi:hypothetical protein